MLCDKCVKKDVCVDYGRLQELQKVLVKAKIDVECTAFLEGVRREVKK